MQPLSRHTNISNLTLLQTKRMASKTEHQAIIDAGIRMKLPCMRPHGSWIQHHVDHSIIGSYVLWAPAGTRGLCCRVPAVLCCAVLCCTAVSRDEQHGSVSLPCTAESHISLGP